MMTITIIITHRPSMSSTALKWAKRQVIEDRRLKDLLSELCRCADDRGLCEITQATIAVSLGITDRTMRNLLPILEDLGVIARTRQQASQKRGRAADRVALSLDEDFTLTKEQIMGVKRMGPTGNIFRLNERDQPENISAGPKSENDDRLYRERARGVIVGISPPESHSSVSVSTHVRFDRGRSKWRASIKVDGVTMDLGRFDSQQEADAFAGQAEADVRRTSQYKAGTPSFPVIPPSKANMTSPALGHWLFGDDDAQSEVESDGGVAVVSGQGATLLAGCGAEPREDSSEQEAARVREGANDDQRARGFPALQPKGSAANG